MRKLFWILMAVSLGGFAGCSEFVATNEQTTAIDVVGEPTDPTTESLGEADIMGSAPSLPDDVAFEPVLAEPAISKSSAQSLPDDLEDIMDEPDVNGGNGIAKPVSLKSKKTESKADQDQSDLIAAKLDRLRAERNKDQEKFDLIEVGMDRDDVEKILGKPRETDSGERVSYGHSPILAAYESPQSLLTITIVYKNGKVESKRFYGGGG